MKTKEAAAKNLAAVWGIWTPWAKVLCFTCHGPDMEGRPGKISAEVFTAATTPSVPCDGVTTWCDKCGARCIIKDRDDVARLHNMILALPTPCYLEQTGGMCVSLRCPPQRRRRHFCLGRRGGGGRALRGPGQPGKPGGRATAQGQFSFHRGRASRDCRNPAGRGKTRVTGAFTPSRDGVWGLGCPAHKQSAHGAREVSDGWEVHAGN